MASSATRYAPANGCKDDWDSHLTLAEFAINNAASALGYDLTPLFIDRGAHTRLPLSPPHDDRATGESPTQYAQRMRAMESTVLELLAAAQAERKAKLDAGRVDTVFQPTSRSAIGYCSGPRSCLMQPTLVSCARCWTALYCYHLSYPKCLSSHAAAEEEVQPDRQSRPTQALRHAGRPAGHCRLPDRGGAAAQPPIGAWRAALPSALAGLHISGRHLAAAG